MAVRSEVPLALSPELCLHHHLILEVVIYPFSSVMSTPTLSNVSFENHCKGRDILLVLFLESEKVGSQFNGFGSTQPGGRQEMLIKS